MTNCKRYKVAAIDLGTVSSRLVLAQVEGGAIVESSKHTEITDLGEGVDATGRFCEAAVERVLAACRMFVDEARTFGAACICTTCTSAARDASNAALLLDGLHELGLEPQVIPGEVEARLTFFGVAHDFAGERIIVADSGGGSTELATGVYAPERGVFALEGTRSLDIGCRRVTERFFSTMPPARGELAAAAAWAGEQFAAYFEGLPVDFERAERLVAVGGTVTTLVALVHELEPYDSNFVHLRELSLEQISAAIDRMSTLGVEGIAALPGVQPKRAGVILAGAVVIRELMRAGGYDALTVNDLCERADTSRGTFYNHFRDKDGLLAVLEDEVMADLDALQGRMQSITLADMLAFRATGRPLPFLVELFDYLREQSDFLHAVLGPGGDVRFGPRLREAVCENLVQNILHEKYRDNPTVFVEYYVAFYAAAYLGIIAHWIERGCPESSETMARIAMRLLFIKPGESIEL